MWELRRALLEGDEGGSSMSNMKKLALAAGSFYLLVCAAFAPYALRTAKHSAKQDIQSAGRDTKDAAKKAGSATKKETKHIVNKSAKKTEHAAAKVERKTQPGK
jgi:hypothetical protein